MPPVLRPRKLKNSPNFTLGPLESPSLNNVLREEPSAAKHKPPVYTINLSNPPSERYIQVAADFKHAVAELTDLFLVVSDAIKPRMLPTWLFQFFAWLLLRRLYSTEQTQELRGISKALSLPMYLLVAYNVFLDLLMGCTSGGVLVQDEGSKEPHMMHFRTLDWGMPALRKAIVQFNFVERTDGPVIATTIGYVGFVGLLTGVKQDLSISLNFRPYHHANGWMMANLQYFWHLALVLLGFRPSISARLRDFLLPKRPGVRQGEPICHNNAVSSQLTPQPSVQPIDFKSKLMKIPTAAAYLILCTGEETVVLEKDLRSAQTWRSTSFITVTNHDKAYESSQHIQAEHAAHTQPEQRFLGIGMQDLIEESVERKECLVDKWEAWVCRQNRKDARTKTGPDGKRRVKHTTAGLRMKDLKDWMLEYPVCNEETHFVCIMDPREGVIKWIRCFEEGEIHPDVEETSSEDAK